MSSTVVFVGEPKPSEGRIYTVHTLDTPGAEYGGPRTFGFFFTLEGAKECVENNDGDIHETVYKHAVIEEYGAGLYFIPTVELWYVWSGDNATGKYVSCDKPEKYEGYFSFGLG